jgi:hypothetical protein
MKSNIMRLISIMLASTSLVLANGGGYSRGGTHRTGDLAGFEPKATENIRIIDEKLHIRAGAKQAQVEVRYLMRNMTDKRVKVRFGFPVEESFTEHAMLPMDDPKRVSRHDQPAYCKNYLITASGKPLKVTWQAEANPEKDEKFKGLSGWNISELVFAKGEEIPVMIRFDSEYPQEEWGVSDDSSISAAIFRYRLSTAACWHGTIASGRIVIEADGIDPTGLRVIKPVNRFKREDGRWVWNFENLEPTLDDDLEIECQPARMIYGGRTIGKWSEDHPPHLYADYIEIGKRWSMLHSNYSVKASSTLKPEGEVRYDPENIRVRWEDSAWSEGAAGPGIGEWLELTPVEPKPLLNIVIKPGYQKNQLFKANARPKTIRVELNGTHRFDAAIPDREEEVTIPVTDYQQPVRKIRLTFTDVYPGATYEDLCVTAVQLHVRLDRKPYVQPAR